MNMQLNRRSFLFGSAAATVLGGCATSISSGVRPLGKGERRTCALIGNGRQGRDLLKQILALGIEVPVICDCDRDRAQAGVAAVEQHVAARAPELKGKCRAVIDFREVLEDASIDTVCIATPDHWHAYISIEAMKHGKDVYCEKPLTFSIEEARQVMAAERKYGRIFQTGSMQRSWDVFRTAVMVVRNGFIGDVLYVDANYGRAGQKLGGPSHPHRFFDNPEQAATEGAPNAHVDWNLWLGPAPYTPYSDQLAPRGVHKFFPMFWRFDDNFGSGYNGDWGAHHLDIAQWGLDMDDSGPYRIIRSDEPHSANPIHGGRRQYGMKMLFKKPYGDVELYHGPFGVWGTVFYGTNGIVAVNRGNIAVWLGTGSVRPNAEIRKAVEEVKFMPDKLVAASIGADYGTDTAVKWDVALKNAISRIKTRFNLDRAAVQLYESHSHMGNFFECVESRKRTISPAEVGARGATLCLLCNLSYVYDTGFDWDPERMEIAGGNPKGISIRREVYRNGWDIRV